jgi:arylamine N-acetyltransferase
LLETVKGDEAAGLFLSGAGLVSPGRGVGFLRNLAGHLARFPYENISKIIKSAGTEDVRAAMRLPGEVVIDHFERNFGGTCFSLTFLMERMLTALGFDCYKVMADMHSGKNVHCLVIVREGESRYMIDPGYALYEVVALPGAGAAQATGTTSATTGRAATGRSVGVDRPNRVSVRFPHAVVEVERDTAGEYTLWTTDTTGRKWRYAFRDEPVGDEDFEGHWVASFAKPTLHNICLTMMTSRGHIYLRKDFFKFTSHREVDKRRLKDDIESFVQENFGIDGRWTDLARKILAERRHSEWGK